MPWSPPSPCAQAGCGALTRDRYCPEHQREYKARIDRGREKTAARGYGGRWRRLRLMVLRRHPICQACDRAPATEVDHIVPRRQGGSDREENLQALCKSCHSIKTAGEMGWAR